MPLGPTRRKQKTNPDDTARLREDNFGGSGAEQRRSDKRAGYAAEVKNVVTTKHKNG